jgi:response regulator RpfG family c-di-GMP phosphodiesterase
MLNHSISDLVGFADDDGPDDQLVPTASWLVLIVDDDPEVHAVTKLALGDFEFAGRTLEFISAFSGAEARHCMAEHPDMAVVLLDVVMESEHSGLAVVKYIREDLKNLFVRIVLRTGQPGQAPERKVVREYDINDYKEKTELTAQKLYTCLYTALSTYRAMLGLEANRRGLVKVIEASATIFEQRSLERFTQGVLEQVAAILYIDHDLVYVRNIGVTADPGENRQVILAASADAQGWIGRDPRQVLPAEINGRIQRVLRERHSRLESHTFTGYIATRLGTEAVLYVASDTPITPPDQSLLELFFRNVTIGLENLYLRADIEATQQEIVYIIGDAVETRSNETGNHVRRVGEYARELALLAGLDPHEAEILQAAAPLHDVGKIGIPDAILNNPGHLDDSEWAVMKTHTTKGANILRRSKRPILQAATIVAEQHHENWDGSGYPQGLRGDGIHLYGRIAALADVFDALASCRCYKEAWELNQVVAFLDEQRGRKFDPELVELFLTHLPRFIAIRKRFPDETAALRE